MAKFKLGDVVKRKSDSPRNSEIKKGDVGVVVDFTATSWPVIKFYKGVTDFCFADALKLVKK
jgi:hypothetical protein